MCACTGEQMRQPGGALRIASADPQKQASEKNAPPSSHASVIPESPGTMDRPQNGIIDNNVDHSLQRIEPFSSPTLVHGLEQRKRSPFKLSVYGCFQPGPPYSQANVIRGLKEARVYILKDIGTGTFKSLTHQFCHSSGSRAIVSNCL